ncbi:MAG: HD domain-containing protein [Lachnospiraceae bacterium]|nr:HD domain-containing protein [Lachnospiraceae bacterium]
MPQNSQNQIDQVTSNLSDRLFDENRTYSFLKGYLAAKELYQSLRLLPYIKQMHADQVRSGKDHVPYFSHPMQIACHAIALGFTEDDLISAALLHDICEDCNVHPEDLPASKEVQTAVAALTKEKLQKPEADADEEAWKKYYEQERQRNLVYYSALRSNRIAAVVKLLDRCNNVSGMSAAWKAPKLANYILETEEFIYPLLRDLKHEYPQYTSQCFLIKYHMKSVIEAIRHLIKPSLN